MEYKNGDVITVEHSKEELVEAANEIINFLTKGNKFNEVEMYHIVLSLERSLRQILESMGMLIITEKKKGENT